MDYHRSLNESENNSKVHIALILYPGNHNWSKKASTSPLLLNSGGPGGSGVGIALDLGDNIQKVLADDSQDIIGFDPRGIEATTPRTDCFSYPVGWPDVRAEDDSSIGSGEGYSLGNFHRLLWMTAEKGIGNVNSSSGSWQGLDSRAKGLAKLCQAKDEIIGKDSIFRYASAPNVVRDMVSIIDAWDEWTDGLKSGCENNKPQEVPEDDDLEGSETKLDTKGKLVYWGISYGVSLILPLK